MAAQLGGEEGDMLMGDGDEELETGGQAGEDLVVVKRRMADVCAVLEDFSRRRAPGRSRSEYMAILKRDVSTYYGYNSFMAEQLLALFPPAEALEFMESCETPRPVSWGTMGGGGG